MHRSATLVTLLLLAQATYAQVPAPAQPTPPSSAKPAETDPLGRENPRGCVLGFLKAVERKDYSQAARYLDVQTTPSQAEELARQLEVVLNHGLSGNLNELSRVPEGDLKDGLPDNRDRAGYAVTRSGRLDILLDRVASGPAGLQIWLFSSETLREVPRVFDEINTPEIESYFPRRLREITFFSLPLLRWMGIILGLALALVSAASVTRAFMPLLRPVLLRITGQTEDRRLLSLRRPMSLIFVAVAIRILSHLAVSVLARAFWTRLSYILAIAGVTWLVIEFSDIVSDLRARQLRQRQATNQIAILGLARRLFKILVVFVATALLLHGVGVNVSAMLASLGIGGIALALAAQKTLEDLFGGISIISREAIRVGDFCQLGDELGTIEDIGLGSTRVRTLDRTIVSMPNSKVSQMNLENYSLRDRIWFHPSFGLRYDTSPEQLRSVLTQVTGMLRGDRRVDPESARIRLVEFGPSSLNLEIFAYIRTIDYTTFLEIQEDLLLRIMDIIAANGTRIALPSQITYLDRDKQRREIGEHPVPNIGEPGKQEQSEA